MNIENKTAINHIRYNGMDKSEKQNANTLKNSFTKMYKRACSELPQAGQFKAIIENFEDEGKKYILYIDSTESEKNPNEKGLYVAYVIEDEGNIISMPLKNGDKQAILEYLGNEKNLSEIMSFCDFLYEKYLKS